MTIAIISPHPDDAVFSVFGQLHGREAVEVVTVMSGVPSEDTPMSDYDVLTGSPSPKERAFERKTEDRMACTVAGWKVAHLGLLDGCYRPNYSVQDVANVISMTLGNIQPDVVYIPSAIGMHADHVLVRDAAVMAIQGNAAINVYADYPYAALYGWPHWVTGRKRQPTLNHEQHWEPALSSMPSGLHLGSPKVTELTKEQQKLKVAAMKAYKTQFAATEAGPSRELTHPQRVRYEVSWNALFSC